MCWGLPSRGDIQLHNVKGTCWFNSLQAVVQFWYAKTDAASIQLKVYSVWLNATFRNQADSHDKANLGIASFLLESNFTACDI